MTSPYTPQLDRDIAPSHAHEASGARVMGWVFELSALVWPRFVIIGLWIFGDTLSSAYDSWVIPALGWIVLPWTTMTYPLMWGISSDKVSGVEWVFVGVAVLLDLATWLGLHRLFSTD